MRNFRWKLAGFVMLVLSLSAGGAWYLYQEADVPAPVTLEALPVFSKSRSVEVPRQPARELPVAPDLDPVAPLEWPEGAVPGELVMEFGSRGDLEEFMRKARQAGLTDLEVLPNLRLVRVRTRDDAESRRAMALAGNAGMYSNPYVAAPDVPPLEGGPGSYRPFGDQALRSMGVPDENASWGRGVRIAVLDTGVGYHPVLGKTAVSRTSLLGDNAQVKAEGYGTHGTAVASLISGQGEVRGIAPGAELMSIQVLDAGGSGSGFDLARGIVAAVDGGARVINMSLGTPTPSDFLQDAVNYALDRNILVVASAGNDGAGQILFPARYEGVVAVGAADAGGRHVAFSNRGEELGVSAPGYGLEVAGENGGVGITSGTSFSTPLVSGALAHLLGEMSPAEAVQVMTGNADDAGPPGADGYYGAGHLNMGRVESRNQPGIYDLAVADHYVTTQEGVPELQVTLQNRGTEKVGNIFLEVVVDGQPRMAPIGSLAAGEVAAETISLDAFGSGADEVEVFSRVGSSGLFDVRPDNDFKGSSIHVLPLEE